MHTASEFFVDDRVFLQSILNEFCHVIFQLRIVVIFKAFFFFVNFFHDLSDKRYS